MCCFVLGISAVSFAQGGGGRMQRTPEDQAKDLKEQLKLSDEQTTKVVAVFQAQAKSRDSIRTASNGDMQGMRQAMAPLQQATTAKLKAILTADQFTAYEKAMAERMQRMRQGGGQGGPPPTQN